MAFNLAGVLAELGDIWRGQRGEETMRARREREVKLTNENQAALDRRLLAQAQIAKMQEELGAAPDLRAQRAKLIEAQVRNLDEPPRGFAQKTPEELEHIKAQTAQAEAAAALAKLRAEHPERFRNPVQPRNEAGSYVWVKDANGKPVLFNPKAGKTVEGVEPPDTADMRNRALGRQLAGHSIQPIKSLSQRLISKRGLAQRATAAGRSIQSALGNDPEYRTYQSARKALAGNLAVAQQGSRPSDADIMAVWLPLVPDTFDDTDESANMKWQIIDAMLSGKEVDFGAPQDASAPGVGGDDDDEWEDQVRP